MTTLELRRIDPARNMRRFYRLGIERDLFDGFMLIKNWGRIGTHGRIIAERFASEEVALASLHRHAESKKRRGYVQRLADIPTTIFSSERVFP